MKKNEEKIKLITIIVLLVIMVGLFGYSVYYAIKYYNYENVKTIQNIDAKYTINANKLDSIEQPTPELEIKYDKLPEITDTLEEVDIKTIKKLFQTSDKSILVVAKSNCTYCKKYEPKLKKVLESINAKAYVANLSNFDVKETGELHNYVSFNGTPTTFIIDNGKVTHSLNGDTDTDTIKAFIDYFYIRTN